MESSRDRFIRLAPRFLLAALLFTRTAAKTRVDALSDCVADAIETLPDVPAPGDVAAVMPQLASDLACKLHDLADAVREVAPGIEGTEETRIVRTVGAEVMPGMMRAVRDAFARLDVAGAEAAEAAEADGDALGRLLADALEGTPEELSRLMSMFDVANDDDEPADDDAPTNDDAPGCLTPRDALGVLEGDDQAVRMYLAAQLQDAGIDPEDIFEGEGLDDVELTPLLYCDDDDELLERVDELRAELRAAL